MSEAVNAPALVVTAGRLIHGNQWQRALAFDLGMNERTIRRIAEAERAGDTYPVSPGVLAELAEMLDAKAAPYVVAAAAIRAHIASQSPKT